VSRTKSALNDVLIIGGGISGMCAAIELRKRGIAVDLVEIDPHWRVYGAGITLSGPTLRALKHIGVIDDILSHGACSDGLDAFTAEGKPISQIPTPRIAGPNIPGVGGILRPVLAQILREHTLAAGVAVRCGVSFARLENGNDGVTVDFTDGRKTRYELVIGADGLQSKVRESVFPSAPKPSYTGQGSWRAVIPRPPTLVRGAMYFSRHVKAGVNPISRDEIYLYVTERREHPEFHDETRWLEELQRILKDFGGLIEVIRDGLDERSRIVYRPFYALLVPPPWHQGRIVLIGDSVHATTPHLASGAGIGIEDALVLAEEVEQRTGIDEALRAFTNRRYERCRMVVQNSVTLGEMERTGAPQEAHEQLTRESMTALLQPI